MIEHDDEHSESKDVVVNNVELAYLDLMFVDFKETPLIRHLVRKSQEMTTSFEIIDNLGVDDSSVTLEPECALFGPYSQISHEAKTLEDFALSLDENGLFSGITKNSNPRYSLNPLNFVFKIQEELLAIKRLRDAKAKHTSCITPATKSELFAGNQSSWNEKTFRWEIAVHLSRINFLLFLFYRVTAWAKHSHVLADYMHDRGFPIKENPYVVIDRRHALRSMTRERVDEKDLFIGFSQIISKVCDQFIL